MDKSFLFLAPLLALLVFAFTVPQTKIGVTLEQLNVSHFFINQVGENRTLHVAGWSTGDVLADEIDLFVGDGAYGAMAIGDSVQIAVLDGVGQIGSLNLSNVMLIRHFEDVVMNNISLLFTSQNQVRLAIPIAGVDFATYNPRSQMIGGDLGQQNNDDIIRCSEQGYTLIDCDTSGTGADLGVQDDLQVRGNSFINLPYGEMWFHNDSVEGFPTVISVSDTWTNVSGFESTGHEGDQLLSGFTFVNDNALSPDSDGIYRIDYAISYQKIVTSAVTHEFKLIIFINGIPQNNTETHRTTKARDEVANVGATALLNLTSSDFVWLAVQGVGHSIDIGTHAANVNLFRMGN